MQILHIPKQMPLSNKFNLSKIVNSNCTSKCFGNEKIKQEGFYCRFCDPSKKNKLCKYCIEICHKICREKCKIEKYIITKESYKIIPNINFSCDCGIKMKHIPNQIRKKEIISCPMLSIDKEFFNGQIFFCEEDNCYLCSICYFTCHKKCKTKHIIKENITQNKKCECMTGKHSIFNEVIFKIPIFDYQSQLKTNFWPIQMINLIFENNMFNELGKLLNNTLLNHNPKIPFNSEHKFPYLLEQFSNTFNRKFKTFYYHQKFLDIFPFDKLIYFIKNMDVSTQEMTLVKFRLMFIILFIHLKKDFDTLKVYTSIDFTISSTFERIIYRKLLFTKNPLTKHFHEKYNFTKKDCGIIRQIALEDFIPFMQQGIKKGLLNILEYQDELEIGLKFICFILKHKLFFIDDLKILIRQLYIFHEEFYEEIKYSNEEEILNWLELFSTFCEIFYMIGANYNDQVIEEYLETGKFKHHFIHYKSEHGKLLLKMILKSCTIVSKHYNIISILNGKKIDVNENFRQEIIKNHKKKKRINPNGVPFKKPDKGLLYEKTLRLFHESIKLFSLTDNVYYTQLKKLDKLSFRLYHDSCERFDKINDENEEFEGYFFYKFNISLNNLLQKFFLNKYKSEDKNFIPSIFLKELSTFDKYINEHLNEFLLDDNDNKNINEKIHNYDYKYIEKINYIYGHLNKFLSINLKKLNYSKINGQMSFSNMEGILLKMVIFFSDRRFPNYLNFELLEKSLSILSLFLTTNTGIRFLVVGKTLSRLNKIFHRYSFNLTKNNNYYQNISEQEKIRIISHLLQFLHLFVKGVKRNNCNLTGHKVLVRLKKNFISHLNEYFNYIKNDLINEKKNLLFKKKQEGNEEIIDLEEENKSNLSELTLFYIEEFKFHFNKIVKIFTYLNPYYQDSDFKILFKEVLILFLNSGYNFCDPNIFYSYYYKDYDKEDERQNEISILKSNNEEETLYDGKNNNQLFLKENLFPKSKKNSNKDKEKSNSNNYSIIDSKKSRKIDIELIFSFFKLISQTKDYMPEEDYVLLKPLNEFFDFEDNDEKALLRLFKCEKLKLRERIILLNMMHKILFMEKMTKQQNFKYMNKLITSQEYLFYIIKTSKSNEFSSISKEIENEDEYDLEIIEDKIKHIKRIELLINIYIFELEFYPLCLMDYNTNQIQLYSKDILKGIKHISDVFYSEKKLWNKPFLYFYSLSLEFLPKTEYFIHILNSDNFNIQTMGHLGKNTNKTIINHFKNKNFNVFNRDEIYKYLSGVIDDILRKTKMNNDISLSYFLALYDTAQERNFSPFCLLETKDYEFFYEEEKIKKHQEFAQDVYLKKIAEIKSYYIDGFYDINNTNYFNLIQSLTNESITLRRNIINYFKSYLNSDLQNDIFDSLLCIITRNFFYDVGSMQQNFKIVLDNTFFCNFNSLLKKNIYRNFILTKNINETDRHIYLANKTKLTLQFLQLLGEDFCTDFHEKIFLPINPENKEEGSIFENVIISLKQTLIYIFQSHTIENELPQDKLIVVMSNLIDFIIEFLVTKKKFFHILEKQIFELLFNEPKMIDLLTFKGNQNIKTRTKIITFCKIKLINLISTYIQNGKKLNTIQKLEELDITSLDLFNEILYYFHLLIINSFKIIPERINELNLKKSDESFVQELIELYIYEPLFRETLELRICFNLYILIKIFELRYYKTDMHKHFDKINLSSNQETNLNDESDENWNINSRFAYRVYKFLEELTLSVEVKTDNSIDSNEEIPNKDFEDIIIKQKEKTANSNNELTFFIRPYLTYFLSKQTINSFINNVNRESATTKYIGLISSCDEFLFEMITNKNLNSEKGIKRFLREIDYTIFEWINFALIVLNNIDLMYDHYHKVNLSDEDYNKQDTNILDKYNIENFLLSILQLFFVILVLSIWFKFKFYLYYEKNILKDNNMTFVYRQKKDKGQKKIPTIILEYFSNIETKVSEVTKVINKSISLINKIYIAVFDTILLNREISVIIYTGITIIFFLITKSSMFLIIPILFVCNLSNTLFAIFKAIQLKAKQLGIVLLFTYLIVYLFSWLAFYIFADDFVFFDVKNINTGEKISESFCYSSIQCWMTVVNYGIRSGGGIADALHKSSFRTNKKYYIQRFLFDMLFHLIVVLLLLNIFLGIIVDAFGELRNKNWQTEKDKSSICFICQLSSDNCLARNIDFKKHINETHYLWNYVYFLTYLELGNPNDFTRVEGYVWDKLGNQDYSWLPLEGNFD